jgi:thiamine biosynthesis protein ThiS
VDYLLAGHVFATVSKPGRPPLGLDGLGAIVAASPAPVLAIGGITGERVAAVIAAGAAGIAVIGAISEAADPGRAASELRDELDRALARQREREQVMGQPGSLDLTQAEAALSAMTVTINGRPVEVPAGTTVAGFITGKGFTAEMVIVELNGVIVPRSDYSATEMRGGDQIEIVHAVGGG